MVIGVYAGATRQSVVNTAPLAVSESDASGSRQSPGVPPAALEVELEGALEELGIRGSVGIALPDGVGVEVGALEEPPPVMGWTPAVKGSANAGYDVGAGGALGSTLITPTAPSAVYANACVTNGYRPASGICSSNMAP